MGDQLKDFLRLTLSNVQEFADEMIAATVKTDQDKAYAQLKEKLKAQVDELDLGAKFHSNKVFIRENHNPPDVTQEIDNQVTRDGSDEDELDIESMWDNVVWNEIEDVVDRNYEVERITATAGVRG